MIGRLRGLGIVLGIIGFAFVIVGAYAFFKVQEGSTSLNKFSEAQGVMLTYNEDGQLTDRGETAGADAIMALLTDDWGYPVVAAELDPNDPLVNTGSEYMYQMATVAYHTLHGEQMIVEPEGVEPGVIGDANRLAERRPIGVVEPERGAELHVEQRSGGVQAREGHVTYVPGPRGCLGPHMGP